MKLFKETGDADRPAPAEKVLPPDGTDRSPYSLRALASIFFVIAALKYLQL